MKTIIANKEYECIFAEIKHGYQYENKYGDDDYYTEYDLECHVLVSMPLNNIVFDNVSQQLFYYDRKNSVGRTIADFLLKKYGLIFSILTYKSYELQTEKIEFAKIENDLIYFKIIFFGRIAYTFDYGSIDNIKETEIDNIEYTNVINQNGN